MSHPINWVIVLLMLVIAGLFGHYLLDLFDQSPATSQKVIGNTSLANEQTSKQQRSEQFSYAS